VQRFFLESPDEHGDKIVIADSRIVYQASKVLRMRTNDRFKVFFDNQEWVLEIEEINRRRIVAKKVECVTNQAEPKLKVNLYQSIPKKPALFELIVQKATELGVSQIFPLVTERTEKRRIGKFERLSLIAMEAAEQCGRMHIPTIRHPVDFIDVAEHIKNGYIAEVYEPNKTLRSYEAEIAKAKEISIIIGPEGGLSESEIELAQEHKIKAFSLGPRILRTETAAISALSQLILDKK